MVTNEELRAALLRVQVAVNETGPFGAVLISEGSAETCCQTARAVAPLAIQETLLLDYKSLLALSRKMPIDSQVQVELSPIGARLALRKGRLHARMESYPPDYLNMRPCFQAIPVESWRACDSSFISTLKSLLKFQVHNEDAPEWMANVAKTDGKLIVVMRRGRAVVWADDVWLQECDSLLIPKSFCEHLVQSTTPLRIAVFNGTIAAEWADGAFLCSALLAGEPPRSIAGIVSRYQTPACEVTADFKNSVMGVTKIATETISISSGTISGTSHDGRISVSDSTDFAGTVCVESDMLRIILEEATKIEFRDSPQGSSCFCGPRVRGLFMTKTARDDR